MRTGRRAWAFFRTSPLRSSRLTTVGAVQVVRSREGDGSCSLNQSTIQFNKVPFCSGFCVSKPVVMPLTIDSTPQAVAMAVNVCKAVARTGAFWSAKTVTTGVTKSLECFSKGFPIPVAIRQTISSARAWTALLVSTTLALRTCPISPDGGRRGSTKAVSKKCNTYPYSASTFCCFPDRG